MPDALAFIAWWTATFPSFNVSVEKEALSVVMSLLLSETRKEAFLLIHRFTGKP
jgi:hypothetical protein